MKKAHTRNCRRLTWKQKQNPSSLDMYQDPGLGFAKSFEDNLELMRSLGALRVALDLPLLVGASQRQPTGRDL